MPAISERRRRSVPMIAGAALGWALLAAGAHAQVATELHEATGYGSDRSEAVGKALQQAALQVCGVTLESDAVSAVSPAAGTESMEVIESLNEHIRISLGSDACRFTGYEVLGSTRDDDGVQVRVLARHAPYTVPAPAVDRGPWIDFEIDEVHLYVGVDFSLIRNLQDRFRAQIESLLTQGQFASRDLDTKPPEPEPEPEPEPAPAPEQQPTASGTVQSKDLMDASDF